MEELNTQEVMVQFEKNESLPFIYVNAVSIEGNYYDFKFTFSNQSREEKTLKFKEVNKIVMSPQHAKALLFFLEDQMKQYESNFGVITLPKEVTK